MNTPFFTPFTALLPVETLYLQLLKTSFAAAFKTRTLNSPTRRFYGAADPFFADLTK